MKNQNNNNNNNNKKYTLLKQLMVVAVLNSRFYCQLYFSQTATSFYNEWPSECVHFEEFLLQIYPVRCTVKFIVSKSRLPNEYHCSLYFS
jgi:hypothetical protein